MTAKDRFLGLLREVLTTGGALLWGATDGGPALVGVLIAGAAIVWALIHHQGAQVVRTSIRKFISLVPGLLLHFGFIDPEKATLLASFLAPLIAMIWSYLDNGGLVKIPKGNGLSLFALAVALALLAPSCSVFQASNISPVLDILDAGVRIYENSAPAISPTK